MKELITSWVNKSFKFFDLSDLKNKNEMKVELLISNNLKMGNTFYFVV